MPKWTYSCRIGVTMHSRNTKEISHNLLETIKVMTDHKNLVYDAKEMTSQKGFALVHSPRRNWSANGIHQG